MKTESWKLKIEKIPSCAKRARNDDNGGFDKLNHRGDALEVTELVEVTARHFEAAKQPKKSQPIHLVCHVREAMNPESRKKNVIW